MIGHYGCYSEANELMYIGSTGLQLSKLEWNHRNYHKFKNGKWSKFRGQLADVGANWQFKWVQEPREISREQGEIEEGVLIRMMRPQLNVDRYPYETSVQKGRFKQIKS